MPIPRVGRDAGWFSDALRAKGIPGRKSRSSSTAARARDRADTARLIVLPSGRDATADTAVIESARG